MKKRGVGNEAPRIEKEAPEETTCDFRCLVDRTRAAGHLPRWPSSRISRGIRIPPADELVFASTTAGSMTGSTRPPAVAVDAVAASTAASASFFIVTSSYCLRSLCFRGRPTAPK